MLPRESLHNLQQGLIFRREVFYTFWTLYRRIEQRNPNNVGEPVAERVEERCETTNKH